jgi:hypothetical protein
MQGKKKVFTNKEINIYRTEDHSITVGEVLNQIKDSKEVLEYLPDQPEEYAINRSYLFSIVHTIDDSFFERLCAER